MEASAAVVSLPRCTNRVALILPSLAVTYKHAVSPHLPTPSAPNTRRSYPITTPCHSHMGVWVTRTHAAAERAHYGRHEGEGERGERGR